MEASTIERTLTELDHVRLTKLIHRTKAGRRAETAAPSIEQMLDDAHVVPRGCVAPDVVTMRSEVLLKDLETGKRSRFKLSYPDDADPAAGRVSVLSPAGWSLLGRRVGAIVRWPTPAGKERAAEILGIAFQPESSGEDRM